MCCLILIIIVSPKSITRCVLKFLFHIANWVLRFGRKTDDNTTLFIMRKKERATAHASCSMVFLEFAIANH